MLSSLSLNNVALIKKQNIDFSKGFNCLLGQSGAGKSIIIDALSFLLGAKADKNLIRSGEQNLRVDAVFENISQSEIDLLNEFEIDFDGELILTRTLSLDGKSSIKINGFPATAKMLQTISERLVDFCGQHDSVGLLKPSNHIVFLDKFGGEEIEKLKLCVEKSYDALKEVEKKIASHGGSDEERERTKEILQFQIAEIESANLQLGEEEELRSRLDFLGSAENIFEKVSEATEKLDQSRDNAVALIYDAKSALGGLSKFEDIEKCRERLENVYYEVKDIVDTLDEIKQNTEFDPIELERLDGRLDLIKNLTKKYGNSVEKVLEFLEKAKQNLDEIENSSFILEKLKVERDEKLAQLEFDCENLSLARKKFAKEFEKQIVEQLEDLEMKGTIFSVDFERTEFTRKGFDNVKFAFSANKGQDAKDLHKTASGGELSRLLLAFKNVMRGRESVDTVVFDEIDAGISGHTAGKLAQKLENISKFTQIVCITHTPVVASRADNFLLVEKNVIGDETISSVKTLQGDEIVKEVARLIDGEKEISQTALSHAKKLLEDKK